MKRKDEILSINQRERKNEKLSIVRVISITMIIIIISIIVNSNFNSRVISMTVAEGWDWDVARY